MMRAMRSVRLVPGVAAMSCQVAIANRERRQKPVRTEEPPNRFQELPTSLAMQAFKPAVPYPGWDDNWDYCDIGPKKVAKSLGHDWPVQDYAEVVRKLYAEHTEKSVSTVDKIIEKNKDDLPGLYKRAFLQYAYGGGVTRHIILVRHGQYDEQRALAKKLHAESPHRFGLPGDMNHLELDRARVLTPLGRRQAEAVGDRLAKLLRPALTTPGREAQVRIHVSTFTRAMETADIIASRLPSHVLRLEPNSMLVEGDPPAHIIPYRGRGGEEFLEDRARDVHIEGAKMEAAFRSLFYRDIPCRPPKRDRKKTSVQAHETNLPEVDSDGDGKITNEALAKAGAASDAQDQDGAARAEEKLAPIPRHEYEIVVCHGNLIRYFTLRALQLPPEAWLRFGGHNCSFSHLVIRPAGTVSLKCFGDSGHLELDEITFGMTQGLE